MSALRTLITVAVLLAMARQTFAQLVVYTNESEYQAALAAAHYRTVFEGFEDNAVWGEVRSTVAGGTKTAVSVSNSGVQWSRNSPKVGITTGNVSARTGSWRFFSVPHGDYTNPSNPTRDGFVVTSASALTAFGGWFRGQGTSPKVRFVLNGTRQANFPGVVLTSTYKFLGVIDPQGFTRVDVSETEGVAEDQNFIFADDFTLAGPAAAPQCGDGGLDSGEECDDGGNTGGDCCSADCRFETGPCDDGDLCTETATCIDGACVGGAPVDCNDDNACTDDSCNSASGCLSVANAADCSDANACTTEDHCSNGSCSGGPPPDCNDANVCTNDSCNQQIGCVHGSNASSCNDGEPCTTGDVCSLGECTGFPVDCDDGNPCSDDSCNAAGACVHADGTGHCEDGDGCTVGDTCGDGICLAGVTRDCDDGNACTADQCSAGSCEYEPACAAAMKVKLPTRTVAPGRVIEVPVLVAVGSSVLGSYSVQIECDPAVLEIVPPVAGGRTAEFALAPTQNLVDSCTVNLSAFNASSLTSPGGAVNVARLQLRVLPTVLPGTVTTVHVEGIFASDTDGLPFIAMGEDGALTVGEPSSTTSSSTSTTSTTIPSIVCGDANGDDRITATDALMVLTVAVGINVCEMSACDVDGTGTVTASDALRILRFAVGQPVALLCPGAGVGSSEADATADEGDSR